VIHARHADARRYPASLTKMMTLYMVFDALKAGRLSLDDRLPVSARAAGQPPSKLNVKAGSTIKLEHAILAPSGNSRRT
jgi:D-alanyl-D-alanine carboxypeptidase